MSEGGKKLRGISGRQAIKTFEKFGYSVKKGKGNHTNLIKAGSAWLTIPLHDELSVGLLMHEIKKAGLTIEGFLKILRE